MSLKQIDMPGIGIVTLYKRKGVKSMRLSINSAGSIRVTLPHWLPYSTAIAFAHQKEDWLRTQIKPKLGLTQDMQVGKSHRLHFEHLASQTAVSARLGRDGLITVKLPLSARIEDDRAQLSARRAAIRALKQESEALLPPRLRNLADQHGFDYHSIEIKQLKGRWGSCNNKKEIVLNCYLMQLPWHLIDYVIIHELVHTRILAHGPVFWAEVGKYIPNLPAVRKEMRSHQPTVEAQN